MWLYLLAGAVVLSLASFCAGHFLFKVKQRWCMACGATLICPRCARAGLTTSHRGR
jgi:hypothetical protein